jgi:hypothetical protein
MDFERCESDENSARESKSKNCSKSCSIFQNFSVCKKSDVKSCIEWSLNGVNRMKTALVRSNPKSVQKVVQFSKNRKIFIKKSLLPTYIEWCLNGVDRSKTAAVRANPKSVQKVVQFFKILVTTKSQV